MLKKCQILDYEFQINGFIAQKVKKVIKTRSTGKDTLGRSNTLESDGDEDRNSCILQKIELDLEQNEML